MLDARCFDAALQPFGLVDLKLQVLEEILSFAPFVAGRRAERSSGRGAAAQTPSPDLIITLSTLNWSSRKVGDFLSRVQSLIDTIRGDQRCSLHNADASTAVWLKVSKPGCLVDVLTCVGAGVSLQGCCSDLCMQGHPCSKGLA
jgi:hypothetical protein